MAPRRLSKALAVAAVAALAAACVDDTAKRAEHNREVARRAFAAVSSGNLDALDESIAADYVRHCQATPGVAISSLAAFKEYLRRDREGVPDKKITLAHLVVDGDLVGFWGTYSGTQSGPMGPYPATGKRFEIDFAGVHRVADGRIVETWITWDNLAVLTQLGLAPPQPAEEGQVAEE